MMNIQEKVLTDDGIQLYIERSGKGIPCIYLHGGPGYWSKSFKHFAGELLEEGLEMIYLDQRGCGRSAHDPNKNYSLKRLIDDLEEVRKHFRINKWYVMGHSFGGILAVNYAYKYPERVRGIILSNATLHMIDSFRNQIKKGQEILDIESGFLPEDDLQAFMNMFYSVLGQLIERNAYDRLQYKDPENKKKMDKIDEGLDSDPFFQQYIFSSESYFEDFSKLTASIKMPVLILAGEYDEAIGPDHHRMFAFSNKEIQVLKSAHHPYVENPLDFQRAILHFIKKNR